MSKPEATPDNITANLQLLEMFDEQQRHQQNLTTTFILLFATLNAGLFAAIEFLEKTWGSSIPVGLLGLASVGISFVSAMEPRRLWYKAMAKGFEVQTGLGAMGVTLIARPFGDTVAKDGARTTHLVHLVGVLWWGLYMLWHIAPGKNLVKLILP